MEEGIRAMPCLISFFFKCPRSRAFLHLEEGQAAIEAVFTIPVLMLSLGLLLQPACLLYTRSVMQAAASEGCKVLSAQSVTAQSSDKAKQSYVLRRLAAVPDIPIFHQGGQSGWHIELEGGKESGLARVCIETTARPLPLLGILPALLSKTDNEGNVILRVEVETVSRPAWLEGDYSAWSSIW